MDLLSRFRTPRCVGETAVKWRTGVVAAMFDLSGDYNIWSSHFGHTLELHNV